MTWLASPARWTVKDSGTMAKYLRYFVESLSTDGHVVRAEILQESNSAFEPEELDIGSGDSPLVIKWTETDKISPVQGSTATLIIKSDSDRQLLHFAEIVAAGEVRLDVYRDGALWWSGTLDSEPYEEPYTSARNYDVTLTFSDFGTLNRIKWSRTGRESYAAILAACLSAAGFSYGQLVQHISTLQCHSLPSGEPLDLSSLILNNDNFYDEEGKASSCFEVLKGILQPFALRIIQRAGNIYLYDLNAAHALNATDVEWKGNDAAISHDEVFNNATVTFSPYGSDAVLDGEVKVTDKTGNGTTVKTSYDYHTDEVLDGFVIRHDTAVEAEGATLENGAMFFDIESAYSGDDASGILWGYRYGNAPLSDGTCSLRGQRATSCFNNGTETNHFVGQRIATFPLQYLNRVSQVGGEWSKYRLRINLDLLFDVRYNPFEEAGEYNEKRNFKTMTEKCGFVWVPVMVRLYDAPGGTCLYHLENAGLALGTQKYSSMYGTRWVQGAGTPGCFFLAYYDHDDRKGKTGVGGWAKNRRCIGYYTDELPSSWATMEAGEYVSLPNAGGYLEMSIYSGFHIRNRDIVTSIYSDNIVRWVAYKDAKITLVKKNGQDISIDDQEDIAYINAAAQEEFSVDTILGTLSRDIPTATGRGLMYSNLTLHEKFIRGGVCDRLEKLLLGTIYSQYASRKLKLSGTVGLLSGFVLGDSPRIDGKFLLVADTQDMCNDTSDMVMTAFSEDEYRDIDYE